MRILVLGVGNILLTDEAIGVRIVEALEQRYTCRISLRFWMVVRREWNFLAIWRVGII